MFTRGRSRVAYLLLLVVMLLALTPSFAAGSGNDPPSGTTLTNPMYPYPGNEEFHLLPLAGDTSPYPLSWWREGWGNSIAPQYTFVHPDSSTPGGIQGFYYVVDRSADTTLNLTDTGSYYQSSSPVNTLVSLGTLNMTDVYYQDAPVGGWLYVEPGMRLPWEGQWYLHILWYDMVGTLYSTHHIPLGIDQTPPLAVSTLMARPSWSYVGPTNVWFPTRRAHVTWEDKDYDALCGVAKYDVYVDGVYATSKFEADHIFESVTLEDLTGGSHTIDVYAIDRAANKGALARTYYYSDPDTPTVSITSPVNGGKVGVTGVFTATATDEAGIRSVNFAVDGVSFATDLEAPFSASKAMSAYSSGSHTITATARDMYGRAVSDTHTFTIDKTFPVVRSVSDSTDPFYPMIVDGYKDKMTVTFWCSEGGTAILNVTNSAGMYASRSKAIGSGWQSIRWDGVNKNGTKGTGTFRYSITVKDAAGNATTLGGYSTTIRDYEIVRIAPNAVKIVPR